MCYLHTLYRSCSLQHDLSTSAHLSLCYIFRVPLDVKTSCSAARQNIVQYTARLPLLIFGRSSDCITIQHQHIQPRASASLHPCLTEVVPWAWMPRIGRHVGYHSISHQTTSSTILTITTDILTLHAKKQPSSSSPAPSSQSPAPPSPPRPQSSPDYHARVS